MPRILALLVSYVVLLAAGAARATPLESFTGPEDRGDFAPALDRAQVACATAQPVRPGIAPSGAGCQVELGAGEYSLSRTVEVNVPLSLVGVGAYAGSSRISTAGFTAFRANADLAMSRVFLLNRKSGGYGIEARRRFTVRDSVIRGYIHGVHADCDVKAAGTNCNGWRLDNVELLLSEHAGLFLRGGDANAGLATLVRADTSCRGPSPAAPHLVPFCAKYPTHAVCAVDPHFACAGIMDLSFLGNTFVACSGAVNGHGEAAIVAAGASQSTTIVGQYAELDTGNSWVDQLSNVVGGGNRFAGPGGQLHGAITPGLSVQFGDLKLDLGQQSNQLDVAWALSNTASRPWPWRLKLRSDGTMVMDIGNSRVVGVSPYAPR